MTRLLPFQFLFVLCFFHFHNVVAMNKRASFVHPAAPFGTKVPDDAVATGYGLFTVKNRRHFDPRNNIPFAKKQKAGGTARKKIQVKMLKHVAGTGQAGQVVMVTPAFFNNKLRPSASAEMISDEEVEKAEQKAKADKELKMNVAKAAQEELEGFTLVIKRKAGPEGNLFGGVGAKAIVTELDKQLPNKLWKSKGVKIVSVVDEADKKVKGDIKHVGKFSASINLTSDTVGKINISLEAEK
mmetsp:Transcript_14089/g.21518  ORF Transcript_14089/g.21518 Transcript_14089/m.21518 type:complete len:241 (-) Transcript_14089:272-994(-)